VLELVHFNIYVENYKLFLNLICLNHFSKDFYFHISKWRMNSNFVISLKVSTYEIWISASQGSPRVFTAPSLPSFSSFILLFFSYSLISSFYHTLLAYLPISLLKYSLIIIIYNNDDEGDVFGKLCTRHYITHFILLYLRLREVKQTIHDDTANHDIIWMRQWVCFSYSKVHTLFL